MKTFIITLSLLFNLMAITVIARQQSKLAHQRFEETKVYQQLDICLINEANLSKGVEEVENETN